MHWMKRKVSTFQTEIAETIKKLNAQFHPRGKNKVLECLQFGGNHEFWHDFPDEEEIAIYFQHCYDFAVNYIGFLQSDKNIICALTVTEPNRRNLFLYYLPITDKWKVKAMGSDKSENGNKLQMRDESGNPIYKTRRFVTKPLLCHSEFWKQRGEQMSYIELPPNFILPFGGGGVAPIELMSVHCILTSRKSMTNEKILRSCPSVSGQKKKPRRKSFPASPL